ncbi:MAG TPA: ABC transporter permease [Terriglobales bacterium]|jgi:peptide/nickel transport system permease protein|nr:ABC transporter permease [Terriglobales bacterium]
MRNKRRIRYLLVALAVSHLVVVFAGFIAPCDAKQQDRSLPYAPPTRMHFVGASGFHFRPFVFASLADADGYREDRTREYPVHFFVKGSSYAVFGMIKSDVHLFGVDAPARFMLLGADAFGRDEFSRLLWGGQISLAAGLLATLITLTTAAVIGTVSGFHGGWVDEALMGVSELFLSLPWLYFLLGVRAFLPLHVSPTGTFFLLIGVIGLIGWARPARLVRGVVLSARNRNYVSAARGFGASDLYLLRTHILPATFSVLLTQAAMLVPLYVAAEATLSFFGLGVSEPVPSWGNMLAALQHYSVLVSYDWLLAPAAALVVTSVMYGMLADALDS